MNRTKIVLVTVLSVAFTLLAAQDYEKGLGVAKSCDFQIALPEWRFLAEQETG